MPKKDSKDWSGMLIPGCMFIGIGIGLATNHVASGTLIGLGAGFVTTFIARSLL